MVALADATPVIVETKDGAINKAFPEEQQPNPQRDVNVYFPPHGEAAGGRIERKSGGRVDNIQPLVDELMRKFKQAKKVTDKTTEPLLESRGPGFLSSSP
jgi:hypothetical protein